MIILAMLLVTIPNKSLLDNRPVTPKRKMILQYGRDRVEGFLDPQLFEKNHILAYYGHPKSRIMGIIGRESKERLAVLLRRKAAVYNKLSPGRGVIPALYIIYGTCQPGGNINIINSQLLREYIDFAIENDFLVYLDHQIGKYSLEDVIETLLPYLRYPNVHLAFDVEWRTTRPMKEIGHITGNELNRVQETMKNYMIKNNIPGRRQLVFHQFNHKMLRNASAVKNDYDPVLLAHTTSGWGRPSWKRATHKRNSKVKTIPYKGFKLWLFYSKRKGIHYDKPLMTPGEVLALNPQPGLIIYQ